MLSGNAIEVKNISKKFRVYYDKGTTLKEKVLFRKRRSFEERRVLSGISFSVRQGEAVGLIGHNGCGKSTLLKMLSRIMYPDSGTIGIDGRVSALIELGAGFHPDLSGRENIYTNAAIFGLARKEIDARLQSIIDFSEMGQFIDNPVRTYSSGMYMRLAFSVAVNVSADILLIDEILGVGDVSFQNKCFNKLKEIKAGGVTIVIVSHSLGQIEQICDRCIWLHDGAVRAEGTPKEVDMGYLEYMAASSGELKKHTPQKQPVPPAVSVPLTAPQPAAAAVLPAKNTAIKPCGDFHSQRVSVNIFKRLYRFLLKPIYARLDEQNEIAEKMAAEMGMLERAVCDIKNTMSSYEGIARRVDENTTNMNALLEALPIVKDSIAKDALEISRNAAAIGSLQIGLGHIEESIGTLADDCEGMKEKAEEYAAFGPRLTQNEKDIVRVINTINRYHDSAYLDTMDYLQFENRFRGRREQVMESQRKYLPYFRGRGNVVDLGCGRGEFLELLSAEGIPAVGVDLNGTFVGLCKGRGLNAVCGDAIQYLKKMAQKADGIFCSQMAEHMSKAKLLELCRVCYSHMEEGSYLVFETPNVSSLSTMARGFYIDPTHDRPVHHLLFRYFLEISGFQDIEVIFTEDSRAGLPHIPHIESGGGCCNAEEMNSAIDAVNGLLFGSQDYAVIARR